MVVATEGETALTGPEREVLIGLVSLACRKVDASVNFLGR